MFMTFINLFHHTYTVTHWQSFYWIFFTIPLVSILLSDILGFTTSQLSSSLSFSSSSFFSSLSSSSFSWVAIFPFVGASCFSPGFSFTSWDLLKEKQRVSKKWFLSYSLDVKLKAFFTMDNRQIKGKPVFSLWHVGLAVEVWEKAKVENSVAKDDPTIDLRRTRKLSSLPHHHQHYHRHQHYPHYHCHFL